MRPSWFAAGAVLLVVLGALPSAVVTGPLGVVPPAPARSALSPNPGSQRSAGPPAWPDGNWSTYLQNVGRTAANLDERTLAASNVSQLAVRWNLTTNGSDEGSVTFANGTVYAGSWNGYEYALDASNGTVEWKTFLGTDPNCPWGSPMGVAGNAAVWNGTVFVGGGNDYWYALDASNGTVEWKVKVSDTSNGGYNWASPLLFDGYEYIGVASCIDNPLVQGALLMVNLSGNHSIVHRFNFVPSGQLGVSIWTTPAADASTGTIWVATGNDDGVHVQPYAESIVALTAANLTLLGSWQVPGVAGTDSDFGGGPILFHDASGRELVGAENKNGVFYALNRSNVTTNGTWKPVWQLSGVSGFSPEAFDGTTLYVGGGGTTIGNTSYGGSVDAVDPSNGSVKWTQGTPGFVYGGLAYANGLVAVAGGGVLDVLNASTGAVLANLSAPSGQSIEGAPSIVGGQLYLESGDRSTHGEIAAAGIPLGRATVAAQPANGSAPLAISFRGAIGGGLPPYNFTWNFGDGTNGTGPNPDHLYGANGTYTVGVVVRDARNATASANTTVVVRPALMAAIAATPRSGVAPLNVSLAASASYGSGPPYNYTWSFGDGSPNATGPVAHHTFEVPGNFTVRVTATDPDHRTANASVEISVAHPFAASFNASPAEGVAPLAVAFAAHGSYGTPPYSFAWSFGDGSPDGSGAFVNHTYESNGTYSTTLTATDSAGVVRTVVEPVVVTAAPQPLAGGFTATNSSAGCPSPSVTARLVAQASGGAPPYAYVWTFGDGSPSVTGAVVDHTYRHNGSYPIVLTATDAGGNSTISSTMYEVALPSCPPTTLPIEHTPPAGVLTPLDVVAIGTVAVLAAVVVLVLVIRRRRGPPPVPDRPNVRASAGPSDGR